MANNEIWQMCQLCSWKTKNGKTILLSKCALSSIKKSRFMKEQEAKGILISLGLKTLSEIPLFGEILF